MIKPPLGVSPMLVSIDLPSLTAVTLAPLPRCAMTRRFGRAAGQLVHDRFARQAVKSVALEYLASATRAEWPACGDLRHLGVKSRVEARHLRNAGKVLLGEADDGQRRRHMQRRESGAASSSRSTNSSIRQCRRSFGPPCTMRCPMAAGAGILQSARSLAMQMIASR